MIDNVGKSFIGGFFRRLGSIFAFIIILFILGYLLKDLDTNNFVNKLLGLQFVKADEIVGRYRSDFSANGSNLNYDGASDTYLAGFSDQSYGRQTRYISTNISVPSNSYYMYIKLYHNILLDTGDNVDLEYNSNTINGTIFDTSKTILTLTVRNNSAWSNCENVSSTSQVTYVNNRPYNTGYDTFKCPVTFNTSSITDFTISYYANILGTTYIGINPNFQFLTSSGNSIISEQQGTTQAINNLNNTQQETNNKIDETNNKIDDLKDTITDNSLNNNDIENELGDLSTENQSLGFFTTFLTLPLTWVQNILSSSQSCRNLELPLPFLDRTLTLPCMTQFWQNMGLLGTLLQAVWLAIVGVRVFNGLFLLTVDTTSSKSNADELTKIRSWEL